MPGRKVGYCEERVVAGRYLGKYGKASFLLNGSSPKQRNIPASWLVRHQHHSRIRQSRVRRNIENRPLNRSGTAVDVDFNRIWRLCADINDIVVKDRLPAKTNVGHIPVGKQSLSL